MSSNFTRRKTLRHLIPEGAVTTRSWLIDNGFDRHAIDNLAKSQQLSPVAQGVYTRPEATPTWQGIVHFLQTDLGLNLTIGGLTALDLLGFSHYLSLASLKKIHLYGTDGLPPWLNKIVTDAGFQWHSERHLLGKHKTVTTGHQHDPLHSFTLRQYWKEGKGDLLVSSPERALLEILADVPKEISFEHADQLMQGMTSLSPHSLQALLEQCENIKVRRLFFWFADRHKHAWREKLDPKRGLVALLTSRRILEGLPTANPTTPTPKPASYAVHRTHHTNIEHIEPARHPVG